LYALSKFDKLYINFNFDGDNKRVYSNVEINDTVYKIDYYHDASVLTSSRQVYNDDGKSANAIPDKNKANIEIVKFFSKLLKKKVEIKKGMKSRNKVLVVSRV
jgi:hypothetical protein